MLTKRTIPILLAISLATAIGIAAYAQTLMRLRPSRLIWDDPNPSGSVVGYDIWRQAQDDPESYHHITRVAAPTWTINLPPGLHNVAVTAAGIGGTQSPPSTNLTMGILVAVVNVRVD